MKKWYKQLIKEIEKDQKDFTTMQKLFGKHYLGLIINILLWAWLLYYCYNKQT